MAQDPRLARGGLRRSRHPARRWLRQVAARIATRTRPEKIILFGSHARGRPRADSDLDVLVILRKPANRDRRYSLVERAVGAHLWPIDLIVRTPEELQARLKIGDSFFLDILREGTVLYES